jgi:hypothetical protein
MSISIHVTNTVVDDGYIYEKPGKRGAMLPAPLYSVQITSDQIEHSFLVTRDTVRSLERAPAVQYGVAGECPPNKTDEPYHARIRTDGPRGFRLELFEPSLCIDRSPNLLRGIGPDERTSIQIHIGPGHSDGCFLLTDDEAGRDAFATALRSLMPEGTLPEILVTVSDRHTKS